MKPESVEFLGYILNIRCQIGKGTKRKIGFNDEKVTTKASKCFYVYLDIYKCSQEPNSNLEIVHSIKVADEREVLSCHISIVEEVHADNVIKAPFILLEFGNKPCVLGFYRVNTSLTEVVEINNYVCDKSIKQESCLHILPGPCFVRLTVDSRICISFCSGNNKDCTIETTTPALSIYFVKCFFNPLSDHTCFLIVVQVKNDILFYKLCLDKENACFTTPTIMPSMLFISKQYNQMTTSAFIYFKRNANEEVYCCAQTCYEMEVLKRNATCITTSAKQFFIFAEGSVKYCCSIPVPSVSYISCVEDYQSHDPSYIVKSASSLVLIRKCKNHKIQVTKVWDDVFQEYYGDFLHTGQNYLLMLGDNSFSNFTITQITDTGKRNQNAGLLDKTENSGFMDTVVKALGKRVSIGQISLNCVEERLEDWCRALDSGIKMLDASLTSDQLAATFKDASLIDVALGFQGPIIHDSCADFPLTDTKTLIHCLQWQTLYCEKLIVGWTLRNNSTRSICGINGNIFCGDQTLESKLKIYLHPSAESIPSEISVGDAIHPGHSVSLLLVFDTPMFLKGSIKLFVALSWIVLDKSQFKQNLGSTIALKASDMTRNSSEWFEVLSSTQQLMSFRSLQTEIGLEVRSQFTQLGPLQEMFVANGFDAPLLLQSNGETTFLFRDVKSPLWGVNFTFSLLESTKALIKIFFMKPNDLLLFLHLMYSSLSRDTMIIPNSSQPFCYNMWDAMDRELGIVQEASGSSSTMHVNQTPAALRREQCIKEKMQLAKPTMPWNLKEYFSFRDEMLKYEMITDQVFRYLYLT